MNGGGTKSSLPYLSFYPEQNDMPCSLGHLIETYHAGSEQCHLHQKEIAWGKLTDIGKREETQKIFM